MKLTTQQAQTAHTMCELKAALEIIYGAPGKKMGLEIQAPMFDAVHPLSKSQQDRLVNCVMNKGLDLVSFITLVQSGLDVDAFFAEVEHGFHPAILNLMLKDFMGQLPPQVLQQVAANPELSLRFLKDPAATVKGLPDQQPLVGQIHDVMNQFAAFRSCMLTPA